MMKNKLFMVLTLMSFLGFESCKDENDIIPDDQNNQPSVGTVVATTPQQGIYDITNSGDYAYTALNQNGIGIIDISDPIHPALVNTLHPTGEIRKVLVFDNILYAAAYNDGVYAYEIGSDPVHPSEILHTMPADEISNIFVNDQYLFAVGGIGSNGYFGILDKTTGLEAGNFTNVASDETGRGFQCLNINGNTAFAGTNGGYFYILDITNPASIATHARMYQSGTPGHSPWLRSISLKNNTAFLADWGAGFISVDVSVLSSPTVLQAFTNASDGPDAYDAEINGNLAYVANGWGGLLVLDVSNPASMALMYEVNPNMSSYLAVSLYGDYALVADNGQQQMAVIKIK